MNQGLIDDPQRREVEGEGPVGPAGDGRGGRGGDRLARGPEAEYVTGSTVFVDGGMTLYPGLV